MTQTWTNANASNVIASLLQQYFPDRSIQIFPNDTIMGLTARLRKFNYYIEINFSLYVDFPAGVEDSLVKENLINKIKYAKRMYENQHPSIEVGS